MIVRHDHRVTDWDGAAYRRVNSLQHWLADRAKARLDLDGVTSLLDVGCGDGAITASIAAQLPGARVVGLDPSPRMIAVAAADGPEFVVGDVLALPYTDDFDAVVSFNALHWVADQRRALTAIARALHDPGRALLVFVCDGDRPSVEDIATQVTRTERWARHFAGFTAPYAHPDPDAWGPLAAECGFVVDELAVDDLTWDFGSAEAFRDWCAVGFGGWTDRLSPADAETLVAEVAAAYADVSGSDRLFRFLQLTARLRR